MELDSGLTTVQLLVYCILEDYVMCILAMLAMTAMFVPFFQLDQALGFELSSLENSSFHDSDKQFVKSIKWQTHLSAILMSILPIFAGEEISHSHRPAFFQIANSKNEWNILSRHRDRWQYKCNKFSLDHRIKKLKKGSLPIAMLIE
jgi:hypothetical protein